MSNKLTIPSLAVWLTMAFALNTGAVRTLPRGITCLDLLPVIVAGTFLFTLIFITAAGWWQNINYFEVSEIRIPKPRWYTFVSGLSSAAIILSGALIYKGNVNNVLLIMLMLHLLPLIFAPLADKLSDKKVIHTASVAALLLLALPIVFIIIIYSHNELISLLSNSLYLICVMLYSLSFLVRLYLMNRFAKTNDDLTKKRYFVEEQVVSQAVLLLSIIVLGLMTDISLGLSSYKLNVYQWIPLFFTALSAFGINLFGTLIYLDRREQTFCAALNRCASLLGGTIAAYVLAVFFSGDYPRSSQLLIFPLIGVVMFFIKVRIVRSKSDTLADFKKGG